MQRRGEDRVALLGAEGAERCAGGGCEEGHVVVEDYSIVVTVIAALVSLLNCSIDLVDMSTGWCIVYT